MLKKILFGGGVALSLGLVTLFSPFKTQAYEVNITTGNDLSVGSTGQSVVVLQGLLAERGFLNIPYNIPLGYYGQMTKDGVARYQMSRGVYPSAGYFGSLSKVSMHQEFASLGWLGLLGW